MQRLLLLLLVACLIVASPGCGSVFVGGAIPPGSTTVIGLVSVVQLTTGIGGNGSVLITFVTFVGSGSSTTIGFCGNQVSQFPLNQTVQAKFTPGQTCAAIVVIIIK